MLTKILGFVIKIFYTRVIGPEGIALYSIVVPTYSLLLTIAQLGLPIAISKMVAEEQNSSQKIVFSSVIIILLLNVVLIIITILGAPFIASSLLKQSEVTSLIVAMALTLPFVSLSSILKGYFFGKQRMMPNTVSNVIEQIVRLVVIVIVLPYLFKISVVAATVGLILLNIVSEIAQIFIYMLCLPKNWSLNANDIKPDVKVIKEVLSISFPTVSSRFIGNIGYFFEPIILTQLLLLSGYSSKYIILEYGVFNAYALQTLLLPAFFIGAISTSLIPEISKFYAARNYEMVKRRFKQAMGISLVLGIFFSVAISLFAEDILRILYNTTSGVNYIKILAPFFVLFYLEGPLVSALQALNKAKVTMKITFYGVIIKLVVLAIGSLVHIGLYGLVIAEIINILFIVFLNFKEIKKLI